MEKLKDFRWLIEEFHNKFCTYVTGTPGGFRLNEKANATSIEIWLGAWISEVLKQRDEEILEKIRKSERHLMGVLGDDDYLIDTGYNQALQVLKTIITNNKI